MYVQRSTDAVPGTVVMSNYYSVTGVVNEGTLWAVAVCARGAQWG